MQPLGAREGSEVCTECRRFCSCAAASGPCTYPQVEHPSCWQAESPWRLPRPAAQPRHPPLPERPGCWDTGSQPCGPGAALWSLLCRWSRPLPWSLLCWLQPWLQVCCPAQGSAAGPACCSRPGRGPEASGPTGSSGPGLQAEACWDLPALPAEGRWRAAGSAPGCLRLGGLRWAQACRRLQAGRWSGTPCTGVCRSVRS